MNSIGVNGAVSTRPAADLEQAGDRRGRDPVARGPVADLVVVLQEADEPVTPGTPEHVDRPAV